MPNLILEIGTEELPVDSLDVVYSVLARKTEEALSKNNLRFEKVLVEATPRRIALFVKDLASRQEDQTLEWTGPSLEKAYDAEGKPTPALAGFLKSKGAELGDVQIKELPKGKVILVQRKEIGKAAASVLPQILLEVLTGLAFPKMMRWESSGFRFARPIRWIVALLDKQILPFQMAGIKAGNTSSGHRFLAPKAVVIKEADWDLYRKTLRRAHVILSREERKSMIRKGLQGRYAQKSFDEELAHITAQLVEEPFLIQGAFSKSYLKLPAEVLASCMKKNQKIFACYDDKHHPVGTFVGVLNGRRNGLAKIQSDFKNVLESRLRDAAYFYESDIKEPLEKKLPLLGQLVYLGKLGTMLDKTERLEKLGEYFTGLIGRNDLKDDLRRVGRLSKTDLMTHLVYEFPDLQGIVGREYALEAGEKETVAAAIGMQYLPKNLTEDSASVAKQLSPLGAFFGIVDRLDLLVGAFGIGMDPSGSQDPYALRRAGGSLVKMIRAFRVHFSLEEMIEFNAGLYGATLDKKSDLLDRLKKFFEDRILFEAQVKPGTRPHEIFTAVLKSSADDLADSFSRFEVLAKLYESDPESFLQAAKVVERTGNILKGVQGQIRNEIRSEHFKDPLEHELARIFDRDSELIAEAVKRRDYARATVLFGKAFSEPLSRFFEKVMVNVEDPEVRANRQAFMLRINRIYTEKVADLSLLSRLDRG